MNEGGCSPDARPPEVGMTPDTGTLAPVETWLGSGMAILDAKGRLLTASDALAGWLGASISKLKGQHLANLIGKRHPAWELKFKQFLERTAGFDRLELSANTVAGPERLSIELCAEGQRRFLYLESMMPPIPELEELFPESCWGRVISSRAFQRMLRSETQLNNLMGWWPGILFSQRPDFSFVFISPKIEELTGIPADEFRRESRHFWDMLHEADAEALTRRLGSEQEFPSGLTTTFRIRHAQTGRVTYLWEHRRALRASNGAVVGFEGIWLDITRQTLAERRLLNMSRRENLGTLTMGMVHDFCNVMTGIVGLSETFEATVQEESPLRNGLGLIKETAMQASRLAHRIRQLHQGTPGSRSYQDLNEVLTGMVALLEKVLPRRVRIVTELTTGQLPLYVDPVELQQAIVNLALNASEAMPNGGQLSFRTSRHQELPRDVSVQGARPRAPVVLLSVQDTGTGIPPHFLESIYDPFFTTKPLGKGSGLGLYNTRLFVEKHNAAISVETKEGAGSTFHLWFGEADFTEAQAAAQPSRPPRHSLLVAGVAGEGLEQTVQFLRSAGYYVAAASGEAAALEALHSPHFQFTALVALSGDIDSEEIGLCQRVRAHRLPLKTVLVLTSGNQHPLPESVLQVVDAVVPLDVPPQEFLQRLRAALDENA